MLKYLEIDEDTLLYKMSETQKKNHFAKVMNVTVQDTLQNSPLNSCLESNCSTKISISWQKARLGDLNLNVVH